MLRKSKMKRRNTEPSLAGADGAPPSSASERKRADRDARAAAIEAERSSIAEND